MPDGEGARVRDGERAEHGRDEERPFQIEDSVSVRCGRLSPDGSCPRACIRLRCAAGPPPCLHIRTERRPGIRGGHCRSGSGAAERPEGERGCNSRSEERRVGKECVRTSRSRWSTSPSKKKYTVSQPLAIR